MKEPLVSEKMIFHFIPGNNEHIAINVVSYFLSNYRLLTTKKEDHVFVIIATDKANEKMYNHFNLLKSKLVFLDEDKKSFSDFLKNNVISQSNSDNCLILHSILEPINRHIWKCLLRHPGLCKKTAWIMWGADIYCEENKQKGRTLKGRIKYFIKKYLIRRLGAISALAPGDFDIVQKHFGPCNNYIRAFYSSHSLSKDNINVKQFEDVSCSKLLRILVGNSAYESNNHVEILGVLKRFCNNDIQIVCPLGYPATSTYKDLVIETGYQSFGDKFIPIIEKLRKTEYKQLLDTIDILVFNHKRQQGLGNLYYCIFHGKKAFVRSDVSTYKMLESFNITIGDTLDIPFLTFNEFVSFSPSIRKHNALMAEKHISTGSTFEGWKYLFGLLRSK